MRNRIYRTEALILRRRDFGEADRLLTIATPAGKYQVIAKGVRKTTSRIAGHIELFTHTTMLLAIGRNLDVITQSHVLQRFATLHADLTRLSRAYYVAELYDMLAHHEENPPLFQLLVQTIATLDTTSNLDLALRAYELRLLHLAGYRPQLHRCVICQELLTEEADRFSLGLGGVLCPRDVPADPNALGMSLPVFKLLRYLQSQPLAAIERMNISQEVRAESERLLQGYIKRILERDLKSVAFLESLRGLDSLLATKDR